MAASSTSVGGKFVGLRGHASYDFSDSAPDVGEPLSGAAVAAPSHGPPVGIEPVSKKQKLSAAGVPQLPSMSWEHMASVPKAADTSLTKELDVLAASWIGHPKPDLMLAYLAQLSSDANLSGLAKADMAYLFFAGVTAPPLIYNAEYEVWYVWAKRWSVSKGNLTRVKAKFQQEFLPCMVSTLREALRRQLFPKVNDEEHPKITFLRSIIGDLNSATGVLRIVKEAAMYFDKDIKFDCDPDIWQFDNCVLDLKTNAFRRVRASDMCLRRSHLSIPEEWLLNPSVIEQVSMPMRERAWTVMWSLFKQCSCGTLEEMDPPWGMYNASTLSTSVTACCAYLMCVFVSL